MADIGTLITSWFAANLVGTDEFGNKYYEQRKGRHTKTSMVRRKRWVIYKGINEPSKVPAEWHAWLHHTVQEPPASDLPKWPWQRRHLPNLTGTELAYRPPGHPSMGMERTKSGSDYKAWSPESD